MSGLVGAVIDPDVEAEIDEAESSSGLEAGFGVHAAHSISLLTLY